MADNFGTWAESRRYNSVDRRFSNSLPDGILFESRPVRKVHDYWAQSVARGVMVWREHFQFPSLPAQSTPRQDQVRREGWLMQHGSRIFPQMRRCPSAGHPCMLAESLRTGARRPHHLIYNHDDVLPSGPRELWRSAPFQPGITERYLFARGSSDTEAQHFAHPKAVEAGPKALETLSGESTLVVDGEEEAETWSPSKVSRKYRKKRDTAGVVISDTGMPGLENPTLTCVRTVTRESATGLAGDSG